MAPIETIGPDPEVIELVKEEEPEDMDRIEVVEVITEATKGQSIGA